MLPKLTILSIIALITINSKAYADLSPNPWLEPNDKETVEEIYNKSNQKNNTSRAQYIPEATSEIDISKKSVKRIKKNKDSGGFFGSLFSGKSEKKEPLANTPPEDTDSTPKNNDILGIQSGVNSVKKSIDNTIQKTSNFYDRTIKNFQAGIKNLSKTLK